jgi:ribosomal protein S18 acetylase RimI-like enzyme
MNGGRAEAAFWAAFLHNRNVDATTAADGAVAVAGGYALFVDDTQIDLTIGAGGTRPLRVDDCEVVEEFYGSRGRPARFELDGDVFVRDGDLFVDRGYTDEGTEFAVLEAATTATVLSPAPTIDVRRTTDQRAWVDLAERAFGGSDAHLRRTLAANASAAHALVIASVDGAEAGVAALGIAGDTAILFSSAVLPEYRRRGVQGALIAMRLRLAAGRGTAKAVLKTQPDSAAERAAAKLGFVRTGVRRRLHRACPPPH